MRLLREGDGWSASEFVCSFGPGDHPFEERHSSTSIAIVLAGTFQYRSRNGCELMTPGSLLLGTSGQSFECSHEHGTGDRCIAISYAPEMFERLAYDVGADRDGTGFKASRIPPLRALSPFVAAVSAALRGEEHAAWDDLSVQLAATAIELDRGVSPRPHSEINAAGRVARIVRMIERHPEASNDLDSLAKQARLSLYHFLRTFQIVTGVTPHQYLLRSRLQHAATRLRTETAKIIDVALDSGFGDVSNFVRAFRAEFGVSPREYRKRKNAPPANQRGF